MRYLTVILVLGMLGVVTAENLYVKPSGSGATNGSDWSNAFNGFVGVQWGTGSGRVGAGDVLYVAGGNYSGNLSPQASGTGTADAQRIILRRATKAAHGTETGWNDGLDAQVKMSGYISVNGHSYITVDGVTEYDIYTASSSPNGINIQNANYVTVQYVRVDGSVNEDSYIGLYIREGSQHALIRHCWISNTPNDNMRFLGVSNITIEYCKIGPRIPPCSTCYGWHADMGEIRNTSNFTYRYNIHHWEADGLFFFTQDRNWYIYGNVWHNGGKAMRTHSSNNAAGPIYVYNNSFFMCYSAASFGSATTGDFKNNIIYGMPNTGFGSATHDYNYYNVPPSPAEPHQVRGADPFFNAAALDFRLKDNALARDAGTALDAKYAIDPDGNTRGADGKWDMGAYEFITTNIERRTPNVEYRIPNIPSLINDLRFTIDDVRIYNLGGEIVNKAPDTGIYLVEPVDGGVLRKVTLIK